MIRQLSTQLQMIFYNFSKQWTIVLCKKRKTATSIEDMKFH